jgi:hypothetical protein
MNRSERERLIERYLNGEMTSHNEEEFFIQVALNEEMRQELKAHRTIESSIRKEREAERPEHTALRQRIAAFVVANPMPTSMPSHPAGTSGGSVSVGGTAAAGGIVIGGIWQGWWWIVSAIALLVVAGAILLQTEHSTSVATSSPQHLDKEARGVVAQPSVTIPEIGVGLAGGVTGGVTNSASRSQTLRDRSERSRPSAVASSERRPITARGSDNEPTPSQASSSNTQQPAPRRDTKHRSGDSIRVEVKVKMNIPSVPK